MEEQIWLTTTLKPAHSTRKSPHSCKSSPGLLKPTGGPGRFEKPLETLDQSSFPVRPSGQELPVPFCKWPLPGRGKGKRQGKYPGPFAACSGVLWNSQVARVMLRVPGSPGLALCCSELSFLAKFLLKPSNTTTSVQPSLWNNLDFKCPGTYLFYWH